MKTWVRGVGGKGLLTVGWIGWMCLAEVDGGGLAEEGQNLLFFLFNFPRFTRFAFLFFSVPHFTFSPPSCLPLSLSIFFYPFFCGSLCIAQKYFETEMERRKKCQELKGQREKGDEYEHREMNECKQLRSVRCLWVIVKIG